MGLLDKIKKTTDDARNRVETAKLQAMQAQKSIKNAADAISGKPIPLDDELKARYAEEDARSRWINVGEDKWLNRYRYDNCDVEPVGVITNGSGQKPDLVFTAPNGEPLFKVTSRMGAYKALAENANRELQKLFILYRESESGNYYRIKVVFVR